jgi:hypothetical protein
VNVATAYRNDVDEVIKKRKESGVLTTDRHSKVGPEELSRKWNIGLQTAKDTLDATTQHGVRTAVHPMSEKESFRNNYILFRNNPKSRNFTLGILSMCDIRCIRFLIYSCNGAN